MKYVVINKSKVIIGPMAWSQKHFTDILKIRHKIIANIPGIEPSEFPYVIDENTKVHEVLENRPEINSTIQYHYGPLWDLSDSIAVANYEIRDISIESARDNFRSIAAAERYKKEITGTTAVIQDLEVTLDTSREGRNIFVHKLLLMSEGQTTNYKFPEGWLTITKTELSTIAQVGENYIQSCFDWEKLINEQIDACVTNEELLSLSMG